MGNVLKRKNIFLAFVLLFATPIAFADLTDELEGLVGYTIVASKTISGDFEGCDYDKAIVFDDNTMLRCASYGYQYSYRPTAIILSNGANFKMIVEDELYDMLR
ncbi:TPA: hypothetical protein ACK8SK_002611 [Legionella pneumophila]|nr:hypothetical protein [Legionella pneumophila subsp. pneumophila]HCU5991817.1 hypothetical protein [Legionella pneumophila]